MTVTLPNPHEGATVIDVRPPSRLSETECDEFIQFVYDYGHIPRIDYIRMGVRNAHMLLSALIEDELIGVAAVKKPNAGYRNDNFRKARAPDAGKFGFELGYIAVSCEEKGICQQLVRAAMATVEGQPIFATTRTDNFAMQHILGKFEFVRVGERYSSQEGNPLFLFVRR